MAKIERYHVGKRGKPTVCRAKVGNCPFGAETPHYSSVKEAQEAIEKTYSESYNILSSVDSWNPEVAKKDVSNKMKDLYDKALFGHGDVNESMMSLRDTANKYAGMPETLIDLHKKFVNSKAYLQQIKKATGENATHIDKEQYNILRQAALSLVQPVSKNLGNKKEFDAPKVGVFGARAKDTPEKGTKEWFKQKHESFTEEDVATFYEGRYGENNGDNQKYLNMVKEKSTYYSDEDYQRMADEYQQKENIVLESKEVMSPLITKDFVARESEKYDEIMQESRTFENEDWEWQKVKVDALYRDKGEFDQTDKEQGFVSGAVITSSGGNWGRNIPPKERAKALYVADALAIQEVTLINRSHLNEENEYKVDEYDYIDPNAKEPMTYQDFKSEIYEFMNKAKENREKDKTRKGYKDEKISA